MERATAYLEKITETDEDVKSGEEFQILEKVCVDGKAIIHEIFEDYKFLIHGCLQESEKTVNMIFNFIEKVFEFACSLKEKDFDGNYILYPRYFIKIDSGNLFSCTVLEDEVLQECIFGNIEEYKKCHTDYPLSETDDNLCRFVKFN